MSMHLGTKLRKLINEKRGLLVPGAGNALAARVIEDAGFEAVYLSGAAITNQFYGIPDLGFIGLNDVAAHTAAIREVTQLPLIVDIDVGFGNAVNVHHTIKVLERAGANAVQIEDQAMPKRCGHFAGKIIISKEEMCGKIKAAVDARVHDDFLIIARTDARTTLGLDEALRRGEAYARAGADILFIESPETQEEMVRIGKTFPNHPLIANMVEKGRTPVLSKVELEQLGYKIAIFPVTALLASVEAMTNVYEHFKNSGSSINNPVDLYDFGELSKLMGFEDVWEFEKRFVETK